MRWTVLCLYVGVVCLITSGFAEASSPVVVSQVYGGGGNSGATLRNDFVELFNRSNATVDVQGWTIQYASSTGSTWTSIQLTGSIGPGQYYLVRAAAGSGGTVTLPLAQATGNINFSATTGKIATPRPVPVGAAG